MNNKTAKLLKSYALKEAEKKGYPKKWALRELKALWKQTPRNKKDTLFV